MQDLVDQQGIPQAIELSACMQKMPIAMTLQSHPFCGQQYSLLLEAYSLLTTQEKKDAHLCTP